MVKTNKWASQWISGLSQSRFNCFPWNDPSPIREELFSIERIELHAQNLAHSQVVTLTPQKVVSLHARLDDNEGSLLKAYRGSIIELENNRAVVPAAEWLLDNFHLVEAQIREVRDDLSPRFYKQLPKLANGPWQGYPRVFSLSWAYIAHTDSHFDPEMFRLFLNAYQKIQPLTIGELWAAGITLRIVFIENLRRLADQIGLARVERQDANALADKLLHNGNAHSALQEDIRERACCPISEIFAAQLAKRLRDQDPQTMPALAWLEERLQSQNQSVAEVVRYAQLNHGVSNVTMRNIILSLRLISDINWAELFESVSLVDRCLGAGSDYASMDFPTRNVYRNAIEQLALGSDLSELEIAERVIQAIGSVQSCDENIPDKARRQDPGYYLIDAGRLAFEEQIGFKPTFAIKDRRLQRKSGLPGYTLAIAGLTLFILVSALELLEFQYWSWPALVLFLSGVLPASEIATALVNRFMIWRFGAERLPSLALLEGIPASMRTMIVVPVLFSNEKEILEHVERLEVHFLASIGGDLSFALLADGQDADSETLESDSHLIHIGLKAIENLNHTYGDGPAGPRFFLLHRRRQYNKCEQKWMCWERKRGKLFELNRLLRGATDTSFVNPVVPTDVRYVIVLDGDTRLSRDTVQHLIGKIAHPLNQAQFSAEKQRVTGGYGILQPRVTPSLPTGQEGSLFQRIFSSPAGLDPYAGAVSDVYQDLFGEGSFTGKGIYDVDAFMSSLQGRVPENTMLSHDLFEGIFARAGLASDVEVFEAFPARYDVAAARQHRWTRGDWQLLPWILGLNQGLPALGRWKMLDNLRRSLIQPALLTALILSWLLPLNSAFIATLLLIACIALPAFLPGILMLIPESKGVKARYHLRKLTQELRNAFIQTGMQLAFLPDQAWRMLDAISRTLWRLLVSRSNLLEWKTAAHASSCPRLTICGFYRAMIPGTALSLGFIIGVAILNIQVWPILLPFAILWLLAPLIAMWSSKPPTRHARIESDPENDQLRLVARKTWRYFETFVTPADNMLPPDNFQEDGQSPVAHRTSPTNMGLHLLSAIAARDFGWAGTLQTIERLEASLSAMDALPKYRGHFFNWYQTEEFRLLQPEYVSTVDSGNLAGHLLTLANACEEWLEKPVGDKVLAGILDNISLAEEALKNEMGFVNHEHSIRSRLQELKTHIHTCINSGQSLDVVTPIALRLLDKIRCDILLVIPDNPIAQNADVLFWINATHVLLTAHERDRTELPLPLEKTLITHWQARIKALSHLARSMALSMDFSFLLNTERKLFSIGYSVTDNALDNSCYDLLASEARLASLVAIAKGDVGTSHWFRLGRAATPVGNGSALISWSGSMFEYLMASLVMRGPVGSLLEQSNRLAVQFQRDYGKQCGIPWGISESAYSARDIELTYQYSNFGVPGLGLKRGLAENLVVAPYATALASMIEPEAAIENFNQLMKLGGYGRYGFYDALDYTRSRLPKGIDYVVVRNFMAHHQGMTIVAIANTLQQGLMRQRFHREPIIQACELLLQERVPRHMPVAPPRAEEVQAAVHETHSEEAMVRRPDPLLNNAPDTHVLSNGDYTVMLTASGAGYSRWKEIAITRWREDVTQDHWGSYIFLKETEKGTKWSVTAQPFGVSHAHRIGTFSEDYAEFVHLRDNLYTLLEVIVSGEDNGEVRRVSITNRGHYPREIELTSYAELVLATQSADNAHPAFSKLFVQTEFIPELGALMATRRARSSHAEPIWAAHFSIVEGETNATLQYETDRLAFIGRGNTLASAVALHDNQPLTGSLGTVLDPVFSLRQSVTVGAGKSVRIAFWTLVASSRQALLDLIDRHHDRSAFDRAKTLAWTQAQVELRHLGIGSVEAAEFQSLAAPLIYARSRFRSSSAVITRGAGPQTALWALGISGDFPILLLRIDDIDDIALVRQLLRAHEYWRSKRLAIDLVILNEHPSSYFQELQNAIETSIRMSQSQPRLNKEMIVGSVFALRADLLAHQHAELLKCIARVVLMARHGPLHKQLKRLSGSYDRLSPQKTLKKIKNNVDPRQLKKFSALEFFNGTGGFDKSGTEYVTLLQEGRTTPAPWINVISNPYFGFNVSAEGSGYTWSENSRENQLTPWSNDPVSTPVGEVFYVQDRDADEIYTATALPVRDSGLYISRHGFGYSQFEHQVRDLELKLLQYVPLSDPIKISSLTVINHSNTTRHLIITSYTEWVLGQNRGASAPYVISEIDENTNAIFATQQWWSGFNGRVAFADLNGQQESWTADRTEFLGRYGVANAPAALINNVKLSGKAGAGLDPCAVLQCTVEVKPGAQVEVIGLMGQCADQQSARDLILHYRTMDLKQLYQDVKKYWSDMLGKVQVKTPDRSLDIMLNGWLLYQTIACRIYARSAFYQASGAYGFRDQLQDGMALTFAQPELTRSHILRAAGRQFVEGDVQHWWLPHSGQGVRTRISDDRAWLVFATATYIQRTGDVDILAENVPFIEGPQVDAGAHDSYFTPSIADTSATLYEHCALAINHSLSTLGLHGLPLMGTGDWNDGMNQVGEHGKGESVWLAWFLIRAIRLFAPFALRQQQDEKQTEGWLAKAKSIQKAIESAAWDGEWYRRATFDDGTWLGSAQNVECRIDSIAQSWSVLSEAADSERAALAMHSLETYLLNWEEKLALLFTPPFDKSDPNPGYIQGYPPGLRENGGQYSHAAMWAILAFSKMGNYDKAYDLFKMVNPIHHSADPKEMMRYKVEPYAVAADIYSVEPHAGRGGWSWYTGASGWLYQAGLEGILGIRRMGAFICIAPGLPENWPGFEATIQVESTHIRVKVSRVRVSQALTTDQEVQNFATLDQVEVEMCDGEVRVQLDNLDHELNIILSKGVAGK